MYKYFPSPWALLLTVASGVRTVTMGGMLAECRETTYTAQEFRHLHPLPWKKGLCPPGGGQKTSLYPLRVYYTVTTGTISSPLPHILPRILGPRAKLVRGFSSPISQLLLLPIKVYLAWQAHTQQDYTWFSIPGVRRTGAYKQHPGSCMAANSLFLLSAPRRLAEICHPQIWHFSILITVNTMGSEKQQMQGDTFSDLLQDRLSKRSSGVIYPSPFPGVFIKQGGCWLSPQERLELTPWSDFVTSSHASWASQVALVVKNLPANTRAIRDKGLIPGSRRSPGGGPDSHSSTLAWRIPWTEQPGGLRSTGSQGVRHDWSGWAAAAAAASLPFALVLGKDQSIVPKSHVLSLRGLHASPLSLVWWYLILNSRPPWALHFSLSVSTRLFVFLLLICLL